VPIFFYGNVICTGAPEVSTENGRVSAVAQNNENYLCVYGSGNGCGNKLEPFEGVFEAVGLELGYKSNLL
jgi:hypothetical protein